MKQFYLTLLTILFCSAAWSQKVQYESDKATVYFGPKQDRERGMSVDYFLGSDDEAFYTFFQKGKEQTLGKYSHELKKIKALTVEIPKEKVVRNIELHMELDDELYEFYSISDKKSKSNKLYCRTIDKQTLKPNKDEKELFTLQGEQYYKDFANAFTQFDRSPDGSKFLIAFKLPEEEDRYRRFKFLVFDRQFNQLWETEEKFFIKKGNKFRLLNRDWVSAGGGNFFFRMGNTGSYNAFQLGNDGEILTWGVEDKGRDFEKEDRFDTYLFKITKDKMVSAQVGFSDKKIMQFNIRLNHDGKVMVSGFYNNDLKTRYDLIDGAFLSYWNVEKGEASHISYDEFSEEFKTSYWSERKVEKYEKEKEKGKDRIGMDHYDLDHVIEKEDGGVLLVGEVYYTYTVSTGKTTRTYFVHGNIIVINVDPDGNILWSRKIPKYQVNSGNIGLGYELAWTNDKLYFLFNDNFKNLKESWDGSRVYGFAGGDNPVTLAVCDIASGGEISRELAWTTEKAGGMFQPGAKVEQLFDNEVIIYIQGGKGTQRLIRVELK
jgi:hypothetical protein